MSTTATKPSEPTDQLANKPAEPPLTDWQKILAGVLIIGAISVSLWIIIALWPNKMPLKTRSVYNYVSMHVTLIEPPAKLTPNTCIIQFDMLILILVAAAGFLGNMIVVASSFAAFVGNGKFERSWILWHFVKPFTAAGLATILYLAINNSNSTTGDTPVNLNGIIAAAALAGMFTDVATNKLRDIFNAISKPADKAAPKTDEQPKAPGVDIAKIQPAKIDVNAGNNFTIPGQNLDAKNVIVSINKVKIDPITVTPTLITFSYKVADADKALTKFALLISDAKSVELGKKDLPV